MGRFAGGPWFFFEFMYKDNEHKVNAKGLSGSGPRLMVEGVLKSGDVDFLRVVVSDVDAVEDLKQYFASINAAFEIDQIGDEYHFLVDFTAGN